MIPEAIKHDLQKLEHPMLFGSRSMAARSAVKEFDTKVMTRYRSMAECQTVEDFDPAIMIGAKITDKTDWDFSQKYSDHTHSYLLSAGFTHYNKNELATYTDKLTIGIYSKEYFPKPDWSFTSIFSTVPKVHVVLHSDEALFRQVWNRISPEFYYNYLWKRSPRFDCTDSMGERKLQIREIMNQLYEVAA